MRTHHYSNEFPAVTLNTQRAGVVEGKDEIDQQAIQEGCKEVAYWMTHVRAEEWVPVVDAFLKRLDAMSEKEKSALTNGTSTSLLVLFVASLLQKAPGRPFSIH